MSSPLAVLVDGKPVSAGEDWPLDRALHFGDGLFETLLVQNGVLRFEALHRARLAEGCRRLHIQLDAEQPWLQGRELARLHPDCTLKLLVSRGTARVRGYTPSGSEQARVIALVYPAPMADEVPEQLRAVTLRSALGENPQLAGLKHCNRLEQVLARQELQDRQAHEGQAHEGQAHEGLMGSSSGRLISGTISNVFLELDGEWMTPVLDLCGVAGVLRAVVLREAGSCGLQIRQSADLTMSALNSCTAMFLTNARMGVRPVHQLNDRSLRNDARLQALASKVAGLAS